MAQTYYGVEPVSTASADKRAFFKTAREHGYPGQSLMGLSQERAKALALTLETLTGHKTAVFEHGYA